MSSEKKSQLVKLFHQYKCLTLEELSTLLNYSGRSAQRLLKAMGYYRSFTHNGKWYTLEFIPVFDHNGLWFYQDIGFSVFRDLNTTICNLINNSPRGLTAVNLSTILSTSCPPVLNRLYKAQKIDRIKIHKSFAYLSADDAIKKRQIATLEQTHDIKRLSNSETITILVEFIRNPNWSFEELASYLNRKRKVFCNAETIKNVFTYLGLEKKIPKTSKKLS